jgi:hypothetical protein
MVRCTLSIGSEVDELRRCIVSTDAAAGDNSSLARQVRQVATTPQFITWAALSFMTTASVASLRPAPTMAVYGLACVFLFRQGTGSAPLRRSLRGARWRADLYGGRRYHRSHRRPDRDRPGRRAAQVRQLRYQTVQAHRHPYQQANDHRLARRLANRETETPVP